MRKNNIEKKLREKERELEIEATRIRMSEEKILKKYKPGINTEKPNSSSSTSK